MRVLTTDGANALAQKQVRLVFLLEFKFTLGDVYFSASSNTVVWAGKEFLGAGGMLDINWPQEDSSLEAAKAEITLNGLDPAVISLALNERIENAPAIIHCQIIDPSTGAMINTFTFWRGTVGQVKIVPPTSGEGDSL